MRPDDVRRVLADPLAQKLMAAPIPARLAYIAVDGTPRAVPIGFHWDGDRFVLATTPKAPKVAALRKHPKVALTIDTTDFPPHVLLVRGAARIQVVDGVPPEYLAGARKQLSGAKFQEFESQVRDLYKQMARIDVEPEWAKLLDFETRFPTPLEELLRARSS
jgi:Pyridoxamine 5'-phosphate oxidase